MLLAIDTSTAVASIALYEGQVFGEYTWIARQDHTRQLMPQIASLLKSQSKISGDLSALGVALGPGSFNGLRVGIACAKALAFALRLPVVGVGTLEQMAYQYRYANLPVRPVLDAGRGQSATALYVWDDECWSEKEAPHLIDSPEDLIALVNDRTVVVGEVREQWMEALAQARGELALIPTAAFSLRRAGYLAELAWRRVQMGQTDNVATLQPIYLRRPAITVSRRACG